MDNNETLNFGVGVSKIQLLIQSAILRYFFKDDIYASEPLGKCLIQEIIR